jgi:hypothetical protein
MRRGIWRCGVAETFVHGAGRGGGGSGGGPKKKTTVKIGKRVLGGRWIRPDVAEDSPVGKRTRVVDRGETGGGSSGSWCCSV